MIFFLNNILTLILWIEFLQRRFPKQTSKIEKLGLNIYIFIYSYIEVQLKKNGIYIFSEPQIETVSIENEDDNEYVNSFVNNKDIWDIINKHRTLEKEKHS